MVIFHQNLDVTIHEPTNIQSSIVATTLIGVNVVVVLLPQPVELGDELVDNGGVVGHHHVLVVAHHGRARPVEGPVDQKS
jgi:hypothetical protein